MKKNRTRFQIWKMGSFFCVMETAVLSPVPQPFDGFLALGVGKIAGILTSTIMGEYNKPEVVSSFIFIFF